MFKKTVSVCFTAFLTIATCVNAVIPVLGDASLESAIITANTTPDTIQFSTPTIKYAQFSDRLIQIPPSIR